MTKTVLMIVGLASVLAVGTACFRLLTGRDDKAASSVEACAGLSGQAKTDCEARQGR